MYQRQCRPWVAVAILALGGTCLLAGCARPESAAPAPAAATPSAAAATPAPSLAPASPAPQQARPSSRPPGGAQATPPATAQAPAVTPTASPASAPVPPMPQATPAAPPRPAPTAAPKVVDPGGPVAVAAPRPGLTRVGVQKCGVCHKKQRESWATSAHARRTPPLDCEACHGPGSAYAPLAVMKDPQKARAAGLVQPEAAFCQTCHRDGWQADMLARAHAHKAPAGP